MNYSKGPILNESDYMEKVFSMLSDLKGGATVRDICIRYQPGDIGIDERSIS